MSKVWLIGVAVFVLVLVIVGLVVALVTTRDVDLLPAGSPEGAVQRYLLALEDGSYDEAYGYLSANTRAACSRTQFLRYASYREVRDVSMTLEDTRRFDSSAVVVARVTVFDIEPTLQPQEYSYDETFDLRLEAGQWRLVSPDYWCPPLPLKG